MRGSLRVAVLAVAMAVIACHQAKPAGPAWPAPSTTADDGGESIEPKPTAIASSLEKSDDNHDEEDAKPIAEIVAKPGAAAAEPEKPATDSPPTHQSTSDDVIMSEEIIIEIED